jgi:hypothetical protein
MGQVQQSHTANLFRKVFPIRDDEPSKSDTARVSAKKFGMPRTRSISTSVQDFRADSVLEMLRRDGE